MTGRKFFLNAREGVFMEKPETGKQINCFESLTGFLVNVTFKETRSGETIRLHIVNELDFYIVSMFVRSRQGNAFFFLSKALDLHEEMTFKMRSEGGKDFFSIHQYGGPVRWAYDENNRHELPEDREARVEFFKTYILEEMVPTLQKRLNPYPNHLHYVPAGSGLRGGYFDNYANTGRIVKSVSSFERQDRKTFGDSRPI